MKDKTRLFKPWLILPPKVLAALLILVALVVMGVGVYVGFFESRGFESTTATIVRIDEEDDVTSAEANAKTYTTTVTYTVDGKAYTEILDTYTSSYKVGKEVKIKYDPENPRHHPRGQPRHHPLPHRPGRGAAPGLHLHHRQEQSAAQGGPGGKIRERRASARLFALPAACRGAGGLFPHRSGHGQGHLPLGGRGQKPSL